MIALFVCICCRDPSIISQIDPEAPKYIESGCIVVPDDTPVLPGGSMRIGCISHALLEAKGLQWKRVAGARENVSLWHQPNGSPILGPYDLTVEIDRDLTSWQRLQLNNQSMILPFLEASSKSKGDLEKAEHMKYQARLLLNLFDKFILESYSYEDDADYEKQGNFTGKYNVTDPNVLPEISRIDSEGVGVLRSSIEADRQKLMELKANKILDEASLQGYWYKLRRGLLDNLLTLAMSIGHLKAAENLKRIPLVDPYLIQAKLSVWRNNTIQTTYAVQVVYEEMLSLLREKFAQVGYPYAALELEWEYSEPLPGKAFCRVCGSLITSEYEVVRTSDQGIEKYTIAIPPLKCPYCRSA